MKTLVTGAAGFIGSTLVDRLLADGDEVIAVDDLSTGTLHNLEAATVSRGAYRFEQIDMTTPEFVDLVAAARPDVIFHLAAQIDVRTSVADPRRDAHLNVLGTINVCEAARGCAVRKIVFPSSGGTIYGSPDQLPATEKVAVNPLSPYAVGKVAGELYLAAYREMYGVDWTSLALGNVYGPRQDPHGEAGVVAIFGTAILSGQPATIFGDGTATRDYVYVDDAVDALVRAASKGGGMRINVGSGRETSVLEVHRAVASAIGSPDQPVMAPARTGELPAISLDSSLAREVLGWTPATDFTTGVAATVDWLRTR